MEDDDLVLQAALSLVDDALGNSEGAGGELTLLSPFSSSSGALEWPGTSEFAFEESSFVAAPIDISLSSEIPVEEAAPRVCGEDNALPRPSDLRKRADRPKNYNPNRARDERRRQLSELRVEAAELESKLSVLKKMGMLRGVKVIRGEGVGGVIERTNSIEQIVWRGVAQDQLRKRLASSLEHDELRAAVKVNQRAIKRMKELLHSQSFPRAARSLGEEQDFRLSEADDFELHPALVEQLMAGVNKCYAEIDNAFRGCTIDISRAESFSNPEMHTDSEGNLFSRVHGTKVLPFSVERTGAAAWTQFSESVRPNARFFFSEMQLSTEEVLIERFGAELRKDGSMIKLFARQIKRRYVERNRIVVIWQAKVDPVEFNG